MLLRKKMCKFFVTKKMIHSLELFTTFLADFQFLWLMLLNASSSNIQIGILWDSVYICKLMVSCIDMYIYVYIRKKSKIWICYKINVFFKLFFVFIQHIIKWLSDLHIYIYNILYIIYIFYIYFIYMYI